MLNKIITPSAVMQFFKTCKGFDTVLEKVKIVSLGNGQCKAELCVEECHTNHLGGLHGGLSTTLVDVISGTALSSDERFIMPSVSVDLNLTFIKGAKIGDSILIDAKTVKAGKTLAFLEVLITNKQTGDVLVRGSHTKFLMR